MNNILNYEGMIRAEDLETTFADLYSDIDMEDHLPRSPYIRGDEQARMALAATIRHFVSLESHEDGLLSHFAMILGCMADIVEDTPIDADLYEDSEEDIHSLIDRMIRNLVVWKFNLDHAKVIEEAQDSSYDDSDQGDDEGESVEGARYIVGRADRLYNESIFRLEGDGCYTRYIAYASHWDDTSGYRLHEIHDVRPCTLNDLFIFIVDLNDFDMSAFSIDDGGGLDPIETPIQDDVSAAAYVIGKIADEGSDHLFRREDDGMYTLLYSDNFQWSDYKGAWSFSELRDARVATYGDAADLGMSAWGIYSILN